MPFGDVSQPVLVSRLVLGRHQAEVRTDLFAVGEPLRVVEEGGYRLGRPQAHAGDGPQQGHRRRLSTASAPGRSALPHLLPPIDRA